ncbi:unnamed protein product [Thelazia callipaeda]|uniref:Aquarius_N domain-containing protein n=1 Tax=Thelazia callipaeda TaxID=103827 RepID=A0A0N5CM55_THECL|nr:unnamed protein product [Thelazia callipaeda]
MRTAEQYWSPHTSDHLPFDANLISIIYENELLENLFMQKKVILLEFSQYFEHYLWPNFCAEQANNHYIMSIVIMLNEKFRERIPVWRSIIERPTQFPAFFNKVLHLALEIKEITFLERSAVIAFLVNCFNSVEIDIVRSEVVKIVSLSMWSNLLPTQREDLFQANPKLRKIWNKLEAKQALQSAEEQKSLTFQQTFMWNLLQNFRNTLADVDNESEGYFSVLSIKFICLFRLESLT